MTLSLEEAILKKESAQAAFDILNHAFRYSDISLSFDNETNRVNVKDLLFAITAYPPQGAADLVYEMLVCAELHPNYRIEALLYYVDSTGKIPEQRKELIEAYFSSNPTRRWATGATNLVNLTQRHLVTLQELLATARKNQRGYQTLQALQGWPNKQHDRDLIVSGMIIAANNLIKVLMENALDWVALNRFRGDIKYIISVFNEFELSSSEKETIDTLLQQVITHFKIYCADLHFLVMDINHLRLQLDLLNNIKDSSEMYPWDAMNIHWRQQKITWSDAAQVLVNARVIPDVSYFRRTKLNDFVDNKTSLSNELNRILDCDLQQKRCYCDFIYKSDECFDPYQLDELVGLLNHPEMVIHLIPEGEEDQYLYTDLSDITEIEDNDLQICYFECQQQYYKFSYENSYKEITILVRSFNNLMQQLGRVEHCYELAKIENPEWRRFFVADRSKYHEMQQYLRLPSWEVV